MTGRLIGCIKDHYFCSVGLPPYVYFGFSMLNKRSVVSLKGDKVSSLGSKLQSMHTEGGGRMQCITARHYITLNRETE